MEYTAEQKAWTVVWYARLGSPITVQREYRKKYGLRAQLPDRATIHRWWKKFFETANLDRKPKTPQKWVRTEMKIEEVLAKFREDPHMSTRKLAGNEGMPSATSIRRILKVNFTFFAIFSKADCKFSSVQNATIAETSTG